MPFWRPPIAVVNAFQNFWTFGFPAVDIKISWMLARAGRSGFLGCLIALKPPKMVVACQAIRTSTAVATFFGMIPMRGQARARNTNTFCPFVWCMMFYVRVFADSNFYLGDALDLAWFFSYQHILICLRQHLLCSMRWLLVPTFQACNKTFCAGKNNSTHCHWEVSNK